jgi:hypothetical protein
MKAKMEKGREYGSSDIHLKVGHAYSDISKKEVASRLSSGPVRTNAEAGVRWLPIPTQPKANIPLQACRTELVYSYLLFKLNPVQSNVCAVALARDPVTCGEDIMYIVQL